MNILIEIEQKSLKINTHWMKSFIISIIQQWHVQFNCLFCLHKQSHSRREIESTRGVRKSHPKSTYIWDLRWKFVIVDPFTRGYRQNYRRHVIIYVCVVYLSFMCRFVSQIVLCAYLLYMSEGDSAAVRKCIHGIPTTYNHTPISFASHIFLELSCSMFLHVSVNTML